jgi:hypothetical protein
MAKASPAAELVPERLVAFPHGLSGGQLLVHRGDQVVGREGAGALHGGQVGQAEGDVLDEDLKVGRALPV